MFLSVYVPCFFHISSLQQLRLFKDCSEAFFRDISLCLNEVILRAGDDIVDEGDIGDEMYIIHKGQVNVISERDPTAVECILKEGDYFDDINLLYDTPRSKTIKALTQVDLVTISMEDLNKVMERFPEDATKIREIGQNIFSKDAATASYSLAAVQQLLQKRLHNLNVKFSLGGGVGIHLSRYIYIQVNFVYRSTLWICCVLTFYRYNWFRIYLFQLNYRLSRICIHFTSCSFSNLTFYLILAFTFSFRFICHIQAHFLFSFIFRPSFRFIFTFRSSFKFIIRFRPSFRFIYHIYAHFSFRFIFTFRPSFRFIIRFRPSFRFIYHIYAHFSFRFIFTFRPSFRFIIRFRPSFRFIYHIYAHFSFRFIFTFRPSFRFIIRFRPSFRFIYHIYAHFSFRFIFTFRPSFRFIIRFRPSFRFIYHIYAQFSFRFIFTFRPSFRFIIRFRPSFRFIYLTLIFHLGSFSHLGHHLGSYRHI
ncbi:uncharacterized protein [Amphiura filiformis]|uniref:uncharacterized protein n=1 Tax=Amphiura filiformis TaxID=82378 RepID=UPI003B20FCDA